MNGSGIPLSVNIGWVEIEVLENTKNKLGPLWYIMVQHSISGGLIKLALPMMYLDLFTPSFLAILLVLESLLYFDGYFDGYNKPCSHHCAVGWLGWLNFYIGN